MSSDSILYKKYNYVFIVTYGRSGSTLLMKLLNAIEGYNIKGENFGVLHSLYNSYLCLQETKKVHGSDAGTSDHPWFGASNLNIEECEQALKDFFVKYVLQPLESDKVIGFKEIRYVDLKRPNLIGIIHFLKTFPNAKIIFNTREIEDVSRSKWWAERDKDKVYQEIKSAEEVFYAFIREFPDDCIMNKYDELIQSYGAFKNILQFLDADLPESVYKDTLSKKVGV